ncbi:PfkB domain protein [Pararhodospirillum photometricum DSM 122]|uniref:PfkB domain protein n=1 Tax=Pararhodospirillum photometricum DSM 122 TaxID=1150469 RepID=H6SR37_PARPM|nr:PfkB domain protein [Pararhodospirillum photometricum DSM 122]
MKKIVTIGEIVVEIMATEAGHGFREPLSLLGPYASGAPAIFIDQVARLGQPCGILSSVGDDDFGLLNRERLARDGADVSAVAIIPDAVTGSAFVRYRPDGERDFIFNIRHSACAHIGHSPAGDHLLDSADHLHVMGSSLFSPEMIALVRHALERIKSRGGSVSFDPNVRKEMLGSPGMREALEEVLRHTDLFLPSGAELFLLAGTPDEDEAIAEVLAGGCQAIVLKKRRRRGLVFCPQPALSPSGLCRAGDRSHRSRRLFWRDLRHSVVARFTAGRGPGVGLCRGRLGRNAQRAHGRHVQFGRDRGFARRRLWGAWGRNKGRWGHRRPKLAPHSTIIK